MMCKMTAGKMPGMQEPPEYRVAVGEATRVGKIPCTLHTRLFDRDGKVTRESALRSIEKRDLDSSLFEVPKDYKVEDLGTELKKAR